jgi:hypothetical protein
MLCETDNLTGDYNRHGDSWLRITCPCCLTAQPIHRLTALSLPTSRLSNRPIAEFSFLS